jgi:hypothetical protein
VVFTLPPVEVLFKVPEPVVVVPAAFEARTTSALTIPEINKQAAKAKQLRMRTFSKKFFLNYLSFMKACQ